MTPETTPAPVAPMAITQPLGHAGTPFGGNVHVRTLPESGLIVLVGTGLLGLAALVRRTTGI